MGPVAMVAQWEELGKSSYGGFCGSTSAHAEMAVPHLINAGNDEQKERLLPDLIAGRKVSSIAVTEPDGGSDVAGLKTRAERKGNDRWVLNGAKVFITNGVLSDVYFVAARTDPHAKGSRGISMFIVEKGRAGLHGRQEARQARLALFGHRRAGLRRLRNPLREHPGRGEQGLLRR